MDPNFVFPAIFKNQTGASYNPPSGSLGLFASGSRFYLLTPSGQISGLIDASQTGNFGGGGSSGAANTGYLTGYVSKTETGAFYPSSNPSGFITGVDLSAYVTGVVVRPSETGAFLTTGAADGRYALQSATGNFITTAQTGAFYPSSNPSGFITGVDLSSYATQPYVTGVSGYLQGQITNLNNATGSYITTGQTGQFYPATNPSGFLVSGSPVDLIHLYAKNDQGTTIYKGQPVYINDANGSNPLIQLASNTGESTSSKTIGLLAQDLLINEFGYVVTEGALEGFDTSSGNVGDPIWLGTGGNLIYGLANKPYGNNHLVYLGVVLRSQLNNGKVYVKVQNGFEINELHKVYAQNPVDNSTLIYNSGSGAWFARSINTGDVSGISNYVLKSETGNFITTSQTGQFVGDSETGAFLTTGAADNRYALQSATGSFITTAQTGQFVSTSSTGAFLTTGAADTRYYSLANGQSISGYAVTGYNDAVTGMSVTGNTTKTITLFQRDGTTVTADFTDNAGSGSSDTGYLTGYVSKSETGNIAVGAISLSLNGGGSTITTGYKSFTTVTFSGEILEYTILADRTGSIVIDVWKDSYGNFPLTTGDSICASSKPTLATGIKNTDSTLTSWTKTFSAGDVFGFNVDSVSGVTNVNLTLKVKKA